MLIVAVEARHEPIVFHNYDELSAIICTENAKWLCYLPLSGQCDLLGWLTVCKAPLLGM
jgi:hypothetical protein